MGTLHEDQYAFFIMCHSFLLRMTNVSGKSCREDENTHFTFDTFLPKIVLFMICGKVLYSHAGHRWQYNMAHPHCMLDT